MAVLSENTQTEKRQRVRDKPGEEEEKLEGKLRERREETTERRRGGKRCEQSEKKEKEEKGEMDVKTK